MLFDILNKLSVWGKTAPPWASQFLEIAKDPASSIPMMWSEAIQS